MKDTKKIFGIQIAFNLTLFILLGCALILGLGFGASMYLARQEVDKESNAKVARDIEHVHDFVDFQLQRIEDATFGVASWKFGNTVRNEDGTGYSVIDPATFKLPTKDEISQMMHQFLDANPHVYGIAIGFEPYVYAPGEGEYGYAPYVSRAYDMMNLGSLVDYRHQEWYEVTSQGKNGRWSETVTDVMGHLVAGYNLPVYGYGGRLVGVLSLHMDTAPLAEKCRDVIPYAGSSVTLLDNTFRFIVHPNPDYVMKSISEIEEYSDYSADDSVKIKMMNNESGNYTVNKGTDREALFYFNPIKRTKWMITIECPKSEIFGGVDRMKAQTNWIFTICLIIMAVSFFLVFTRVQKITESKAGIESELNVASSIQMGMIPKLYPAFPERHDLDVYGMLKPAKSVGGDLFDYFVKGEKFFFCVGDVSGKGVPASLYMAVIRSLFRNVSLHEDDPSEIVSALNTGLSEGNTHNMFCTFFVGVLDLSTGHVDYCNAGHNSPIIRRKKDDGSVDVHFMNPDTNLAVGIIDEFDFTREETVLKPGEAIFLYTDGVCEAENVKKELFGDQATLNALAAARAKNVRSAKDFVDAVYDSVHTFTQGAEQSDDITMVVVEYKGREIKQ